MKAGRVVRLRVSPKDAMSVADLVSLHKMPTMGFSAAVSYSLAVLLETARSAKMLPVRDGFEYNELMEVFLPSQQGQGRKLAIAKQVEAAGSSFQVAGLMAPENAREPVKECNFQLAELQKKFFHDQWSAEDGQKWQELFPQVYPGEPIRLPDGTIVK